MSEFLQVQSVCIDPRERSSVRVDKAVIRASAELKPCAAVLCSDAALGQGFGAVSVYLASVQGSGDLPVITWELRARFGGSQGAELVTTASAALAGFTSWQSEGSIWHLSGRRALGFELWAASDGDVALPCEVRFIVAPASAGVPWHSQAGTLA